MYGLVFLYIQLIVIWSRLQKGKLGSPLINDYFNLEVILKKIGGLTNLSLYGIIITIGSVATYLNQIQAFELKGYLFSCWPTWFNEQTASKKEQRVLCPALS